MALWVDEWLDARVTQVNERTVHVVFEEDDYPMVVNENDGTMKSRCT